MLAFVVQRLCQSIVVLLVMTVSLIGVSLTTFVVGLGLYYNFAVNLPLEPPAERPL